VTLWVQCPRGTCCWEYPHDKEDRDERVESHIVGHERHEEAEAEAWLVADQLKRSRMEHDGLHQ